MTDVMCRVAVVDRMPSSSDVLSAVVSHAGFQQLKTEVECCYTVLGQLESTVLNVSAKTTPVSGVYITQPTVPAC